MSQIIEATPVETLASAKPVEQEFLALTSNLAELQARAKSIVVTDIADTAGMKLARETRLGLRQIRIAVENRRKELKAEYLEKGRRIDGAAKQFSELIEPLEARLLEQEEFAERAAAKRLAEIQASRAEDLRAAGTLPALIPQTLAYLSEEDWQTTLAAARRYAAEIAAEAKRKAEEDARLAAEAAEERKRLAAEASAANARAAEERKARAAAEAEAANARRAAAEAEQKRRDAEAAAAAEKARIAAEAEAEARRAALAPDAQKIREFAARVHEIAPSLADGNLSVRLSRGIAQFCDHLEKLASL